MKKWMWLVGVMVGITVAASNLHVKADTTQGIATSSTTDINQPSVNEALYVEKTFAATQAAAQGYVIHNWSQASTAFESIPNLKTRADKIQQELHIQKSKIISRSVKNENFYEVTGEWPHDTKVSVTLTSFRFPDAPSSTILVVRADSQASTLEDFVKETGVVDDAVRLAGCVPQISTCIEGFTDARMSSVQTDRLISQALAAVNAKRVEGVTSDLVTSISAYTEGGPAYILTNGHKMNLQVAIHYDAYHHHTNVVVGSPVITVTY